MRFEGINCLRLPGPLYPKTGDMQIDLAYNHTANNGHPSKQEQAYAYKNDSFGGWSDAASY
jgi:hypothetical protein